MPSCPAGLSVSNHALNRLATALRHSRNQLGTRWRRLTVGRQALLVIAHLRKARPTPTSLPGSGSARPPRSATSAKPSTPAADPPRLLDRPRRSCPSSRGTLIRLQVDHLPGDRDPKPVWLWTSTTTTAAADVDRFWQVFLRRFDIEHTFRLLKQTLGWTTPKPAPL